jgi:TrmH RNA methyltransferase
MTDSPYRGPQGKPRDKRERERDRAARPAPAAERPGRPQASERARHGPDDAGFETEPREPREQRLYGINACLAMFRNRPDDLRKVWLLESRLTVLKAVVAHCVKHRLGYSVVSDDDLRRLSGSEHHEGVVFAAMPAGELGLSGWLRDLAPGPQLAIWLDGVGNPHNLGAILRSSAHFGVAGLLLPKHSPLALSGAAARVAEGGAERVPMVRLGRPDNSLAQLRSAGFVPVATVVRGGEPLYGQVLPERLLLMMGAEQAGIDPALAGAAALRLAIPGTGAVESLNVAAATALFVGEWWRQRRA